MLISYPVALSLSVHDTIPAVDTFKFVTGVATCLFIFITNVASFVFPDTVSVAVTTTLYVPAGVVFVNLIFLFTPFVPSILAPVGAPLFIVYL